MEFSKKHEIVKSNLNYYIIGLIVFGAIIYGIGNAGEPDVASELDLYELLIVVAYAVATGLCFIISFRYKGSEIFGKAYFALAIGISGKLIGWSLWFVYQIYYQIQNPYPYWPDLFFVIYFAGTLTHLRMTSHYFIPKLNIIQKLFLTVVPLITALVFIYFSIYPLDLSGTVTQEVSFNPIWEYGWDYHKEFLTSVGFVVLSIFTLCYSIVGFKVFKGGILGPAWGLLISGLAIKSVADIQYYFSELFGIYDRAQPMTMMWVLGIVVMAYALYKHRSL